MLILRFQPNTIGTLQLDLQCDGSLLVYAILSHYWANISLLNRTLLHLGQEEIRAEAHNWRTMIPEGFERARKLGEQLLGLVKFMVFQNLHIYREVVAIRTTQSSRLERPIPEEFFTLEDAAGRIMPIHLRTVDSWDAFRVLLAIRFKDRKGASRVARNRYTLQEYGSREIIEQNLPWNTTFISGQRVNMSVICRLSDPVNDNSMSSCPKCGVVSQLPCNVDVQWQVEPSYVCVLIYINVEIAPSVTCTTVESPNLQGRKMNEPSP